MSETHHQGELRELSHEAQPGYKPWFWAVTLAAAAYLAVIFLAGGGH